MDVDDQDDLEFHRQDNEKHLRNQIEALRQMGVGEGTSVYIWFQVHCESRQECEALIRDLPDYECHCSPSPEREAMLRAIGRPPWHSVVGRTPRFPYASHLLQPWLDDMLAATDRRTGALLSWLVNTREPPASRRRPPRPGS